MKIVSMEDKITDVRKCKIENKLYLRELEKFLDMVENVENDGLRMDLIYQMLKCDEILTKIAEGELKNESY